MGRGERVRGFYGVTAGGGAVEGGGVGASWGLQQGVGRGGGGEG